jgi:hypothetical protein
MVLAVLPPGGTFIDDDGNVHEGGIEAIAAAGITTGCNPPTNNRYCPSQTVTRGQMAAFIVRALGLTQADQDQFTDDAGHRFEAAINRLAGAGITLGCNPPDNDRFCPDQAIARDEMATFLTRTTGLTANRPPPRPFPVVTVVPREDWGALSPDTERMIAHTVTRLTVHHAGTQSGTVGPPQYRGWQAWHMGGQKWPDIAYHVLIGIDGTVYQGRDPAYRGDTATTYDTTGHFLVAVEGNFEVERPSQAQIQSLEMVLAWASQHYGVSPETIGGHGDYAATSCPGRHLEDRIRSGELQTAVESIIDRGGVELLWP